MSLPFDKLASLDLKMLRTLLVLIETQNVSQAAERLGLQQSTVSYQLGKLRDSLDDPLLIRSGRGLEPSPYAKKIQPGLSTHFNSIENLLFGDGFDEKTATGKLRLACHRNGSRTFIRELLFELKQRLPLIHLEIIDWSEQVPSLIREDKIDFAVGFEPEHSSQIMSLPLVEVGYQVVMCSTHPMGHKTLSEETIFDYPHAMLSSNEAVERWLTYLADKKNKTRLIEFKSSSMEFTTMALEDTERLMFVADTNDNFFDSYNVMVQPAPFIAKQAVKLLFHERASLDPLKQCMMDVINAAASKAFERF